MIRCCGRTDLGRRRRSNEDTIWVDKTLSIVCDGMGGHRAGDVASRTAVDAITAFVDRSRATQAITWPYGFDPRLSYNGNRLRAAIKLANRAVFAKAASALEYAGMGTTVAAALLDPSKPRMTYAHVGDSRLYLIHDGRIVQLTRDDSWASSAFPEFGADAVGVAMRHVLTKALGAKADVEFRVGEHELQPGDIALLCSDGLTNMLSDERIFQIAMAHVDDLEAACRQLVARANDEGGRDNISVILLHHAGAP